MRTVHPPPLKRFAPFERDRATLLRRPQNAPRPGWQPAVDIQKQSDRYRLWVDVPGVDPQSLEIVADNGYLTIKGERRRDDDSRHGGFRRVERLQGRRERRFRLPETADIDAVSASSAYGVLTVDAPKKAQSQPRRIDVAA